MHICFVSREYPPNLMGGIGTYVVNMTRILAKAGHTVTVLTHSHPDAPCRGYGNPDVSVEGRLRVHYLPFVTPDWQLEPIALAPEVVSLMQRDLIGGFSCVLADALEQLLVDEAVDVIEAPEYEAPLLVFQQRRAMLPPGHPFRKVPTVVHLHSPSHMIFLHNDDPLGGKWVRARKAHEALSITLADAVLSPSAFLAQQVRDWLDLAEARVTVIPYPIGPLLEYEEACEAEPGLCLFVGRVEPRKGVFEFVEAAVAVARDFPHLRFRFVGGPHLRGGSTSGEETAQLIHSLIPAPLRDRFDFAGRVPRHTLGVEYRRASFVAVPSRWDNYPNTCMEAMSCGRPVLATDQGGMAEMLEHGVSGFLGPCGEGRHTLVPKLVEGLRSFAAKSAEALAQMGNAARRRILEICDDAAITRRHIDYYTALCERLNEFSSTPRLRTAVALFHEDLHSGSLAQAIQAVNQQEGTPAARIILGENVRDDSSLMDDLEGWTMLRDAGEAILTGDGPTEERLDKALEGADVVYLGYTSDVLAPGALTHVEQFFRNHPEMGACQCWLRCSGEIVTAVRVDPDHLLAPAPFPERWFFRLAALRKAGGILKNGYYLPDLLRDAVLRLVAEGWKLGAVASPLVSVQSSGMSRQILRPFGFQEPRDSVRVVALAHQRFFASDPVSTAEQLTRPVE